MLTIRKFSPGKNDCIGTKFPVSAYLNLRKGLSDRFQDVSFPAKRD